jgi:signal transduction histidine kinase
MQRQLIGALRQKERLAQLGSAVAKISHDLRNILTTAQLFADRLEGIRADPAVARAAPEAVGSISRAVSAVRIDAGLRQGRGAAAVG